MPHGTRSVAIRQRSDSAPDASLWQILDEYYELATDQGGRAQPQRCAHDFDVDLNGDRAAQDAGEYGDALLGERIGRCTASAMGRFKLEITNCDLKIWSSWAVSWNMKSAGKRSILRFIASFKPPVLTP